MVRTVTKNQSDDRGSIAMISIEIGIMRFRDRITEYPLIENVKIRRESFSLSRCRDPTGSQAAALSMMTVHAAHKSVLDVES
jgi:hypothetical protein